MNHPQTLSQIEQGRVVAILRGDFGGREHEMVAAMIEGGLTAVEVTLNSPDALIKIAQLATVVPGAGMYAVGLLIVLLAAIAATFDPHVIWTRVVWADGTLPPPVEEGGPR